MKNFLWLVIPLLLVVSCGSSEQSDANTTLTEPAPAETTAVDTSYTGKALNHFEEAILAFEAEDATREQVEGTILFTGSSSIRMWSSLAEDFAPVPILNRGFGGSTLPEVIHYADRIIFNYAPEVIVLYCGENDIAEGASADQVFESFQKIDRMIEQRLPNSTLIYIAMKPSPSRWALWPQYQTGDRMISAYLKGKSKRHFVDCSPSMLLPSGEPDSSIFIEDMLHMNPKGYDGWEALIEPVVLKAINQE